MRRKSSGKRTASKRVAKKSSKVVASSSEVVRVVSSTTRTDGAVSLSIGHVDSLLDRIRFSSVKKFDSGSIDQLKNLSEEDLNHVKRQYCVSLDGMKNALAGDEYDLEAWSNFTLPQLALAVEYLTALNDLEHDESSDGKLHIRQKKAPQKPKEQPPEKIVSKLLFLDQDKETGIKSINPIEIVGASELWIYNTKTRKLGFYAGLSPAGLSVKGTTILNYDEEASKVKTLRQPLKQMRQLMNGSKPLWFHHYWDAVKSVPQAIPPRIGRETLILKSRKP